MGRWLASDPHNPGVFALSTQGGGVWRTADHGATWTRITIDATEGQVNYRPIISSLLDGNIYWCQGAGYSWSVQNLYTGGAGVQKLGQTLMYSGVNVSEDPVDANRLYTGISYQGVQVYNGGDVTGVPAPPFAIRGDHDHDGDVDQDDFGRFQACLSGPGIPQHDPLCPEARLDADEDVDTADLTLFRQCFSGANVPAPPECRCGATAASID